MTGARLTPEVIDGLESTGPTDPIGFYKRPLVGKIFRARINQGLDLLPKKQFRSGLEVGYGAGALQLVLAPHVDELHGIDLDADPKAVGELLASRGKSATLVQGSVYELPYDDRKFDLVVCFSVFEHLHEYERGLREVARVMTDDGVFLLGMPAVNRMMEVGFRAIGFKGINDIHVTTPATVARRFGNAGLRVLRSSRLGVPRVGPSLYYNWLLGKA